MKPTYSVYVTGYTERIWNSRELYENFCDVVSSSKPILVYEGQRTVLRIHLSMHGIVRLEDIYLPTSEEEALLRLLREHECEGAIVTSHTESLLPIRDIGHCILENEEPKEEVVSTDSLVLRIFRYRVEE